MGGCLLILMLSTLPMGSYSTFPEGRGSPLECCKCYRPLLIRSCPVSSNQTLKACTSPKTGYLLPRITLTSCCMLCGITLQPGPQAYMYKVAIGISLEVPMKWRTWQYHSRHRACMAQRSPMSPQCLRFHSSTMGRSMRSPATRHAAWNPRNSQPCIEASAGSYRYFDTCVMGEGRPLIRDQILSSPRRFFRALVVP